jgi:two-component system chemotaxis response regulator CheB
MKRTRVLLVDDSPIFTEALSLTLADSQVEIVGIARHGEEAVAMNNELAPDLVLMDVMMPVMDGLAAIERIMASRPTPILVMTGDPRGRSGELSLEALARGALDLVPKPSGFPLSAAARRELLQKIELLASVSVVRHIRGHRHRWRRSQGPPDEPRRQSHLRVVATVGSTGGPSALARILGALPFDFPAAVVVVQHMSAAFADAFCRWLDHASALEVRTAQQGDALAPGVVLIAPPDKHIMVTSKGSVRLDEEPRSQAHVPSGDVLLRSLAATQARRATGVVLTGMGHDGAEGLLALRHAGGMTIAQDEASSVVDGMPRAARGLGAASKVLPLEEIASFLQRLHAVDRER